MKTRFFNSLLCLVAIFAAVLFTPVHQAHAQAVVYHKAFNGMGTAGIATTTLTNSFPHESTNFYSTNFSLGSTEVIKSTTAGVSLSGRLNGAGTTAITFELDQSLDGSIWKTNVHQLIVTPAGTAQFNYVTNSITVGNALYLRIGRIYNANTAAITNFQAVLSYKNGL